MVNSIWSNVLKNREKEKSIQAILQENILFQNLTNRELRFLEKIVHIRKYHQGEHVFRIGDVGVGMYMIATGSINIMVEDFDEDPLNPKLILVTRLLKGDFFGELALVEENGRRSASAIACEESTLIGFFKPDLLEIAERSPSTGVKIIMRLGEVLGVRLADTTKNLTELKKELRQLKPQV